MDFQPDPATVTLPADAFVRLVYGRLDAEHTPADEIEWLRNLPSRF